MHRIEVLKKVNVFNISNVKPMKSVEVRNAFFDFFRAKQHKIVPSAPIVVKDDPTLMFINAGMNQFKDYFLGNRQAEYNRIANAQKCLRVSGKHNDLDEVGLDTYHHTMFEMLGNWSFGDYFKNEAIQWAWEFLTEVMKIDPSRLFATVFGGDKEEALSADEEARKIWLKYLPESRVLNGSKKDNFWEMGDVGPCGPCSEIHIDIRSEDERKLMDGSLLVNKDHPLVIEIWNLVFIQFNRLSGGELVLLPQKHVDTGMGFERLCMVMQNKNSNYDTDLFQPLIQTIANLSNIPYGKDRASDIAMRVIADHIRAIAFAISDGQLPANVKAGYVIRRILRRAVRYGFTYLDFREPFIFNLVPVLVEQLADAYPNLEKQKQLVTKVIREEEYNFLKTLDKGIQLIEKIVAEEKNNKSKVIDGKTAFELYDTYGFPLDLTELILGEKGLSVDREGFQQEMQQQKERSRTAGTTETGDWIILDENCNETFVGYDNTTSVVRITRYRKVKTRDKDMWQLVFNTSPFYAESGGQVGDIGYLEHNGEKTLVVDTKKENEVTVHLVEQLPKEVHASFVAVVDQEHRQKTAANHTATHLLHNALRAVLGEHIEQKGSLVHPDYLRFDFSHFQKVSNKELKAIEQFVNHKIQQNISLEEKRQIPLPEAKKMGAISLFGEKYGELVRVIKFNNAVELCGGTHVPATGHIGVFKVVSESAIAAGIRRMEALTGQAAISFYEKHLDMVSRLKEIVRNPNEPLIAVEHLMAKNSELEKTVEVLMRDIAKKEVEFLLDSAQIISNIRFIGAITALNMPAVKDMAFYLRKREKNLVMVLGVEEQGKALLSVVITDDLIKAKGLNAGVIIKTIAQHIKGGGGGQPFFATAGGKEPKGLQKAIDAAREIIENMD